MSKEEVSCVYRSPLGPIKLVANSDGICEVKFLFGEHMHMHGSRTRGSAESEGDLGEHKRPTSPPPLELAKGNSDNLRHLRTCGTWLDAYFNCKLSKDVIKPALVIPHESEFFNTVWTALASTAIGETLSYKSLAKLAGRQNAARAVGRAMKSNRLPILVPCHRVVKSNQCGIGNYSGGEGEKTKQWLLDHEKKMTEHVTSNTAS